MDSFDVSKEDLKIIEKQLGRIVSNVLNVEKRCIYGYPQVIKSFPLKDGKPFPTLYWLTCPYLVEEVSKLEAQGRITEIEKIIQNDPELKMQMILAHKEEIEKRMKILEGELNSLSKNIIKKLKETGIGGIKNFSTIKCLHLHYASYLSRENNPVGKIVDSYISKKYCDDKRCENLMPLNVWRRNNPLIDRSIIKNIPKKPGVYIFKNNKGDPIYIGKAKNLKNRVSSYFNKKNYIGNEKTYEMLEKATNFDYILTSNENQAFILEANLIYAHKPKYNIMLKDTRVYPYILVTDEQFPKIKYVRTKKEEKGKYYGPYSDVKFVKDVIEVLQSVYKIRSCDRDLSRKSKPCFLYHLGRCYGPCYKDVDEKAYQESVEKVKKVLSGDIAEVKNYLQKSMKDYAKIKNYEKAAQMRDTLFKLENLFEEVAVEYQNGKNIDIIMYESPVYLVLIVRKGYLISKLSFTMEGTLEDFLYQYYIVRKNEPPSLISTLYNEEISPEILAFLKEKGLKRIEKIGKNSKIYEMAYANLQEEIKRQKDLSYALKQAKEILSLKKEPKIIEGIDISHLQGLYTVASLVRFENGKPNKEGYRKYRLDNIKAPDDFESIRTVIKRRYQKHELPDLLFIDGGKGQVNSAVEALKEIGYSLKDVDVVGIAKEDERIVFPGEMDDLHLSLDHPVLRLLIYVRDETHRFAIGFNRSLRSKRFEKTKLDDIYGIGPKRKKELIKHFGGVQKVLEASTEEISKVVKSEKIAKRIKESLGEK